MVAYYISIHAPREGSDRSGSSSAGPPVKFLSTLPARGATESEQRAASYERFLSTLPARGATACPSVKQDSDGISIHAPREGSDCRTWYMDLSDGRFLSTLPARGATPVQPLGTEVQHDFYPRSPRGERPSAIGSCEVKTFRFLSTLPARGATP